MKAGKESEMTIINLIKKLEEKSFKQAEAGKEAGGEYAVLEAWYQEMLTLNPDKYAERDYYYHNINGFIWGLKAADYITQTEKNELTENLMQTYRN